MLSEQATSLSLLTFPVQEKSSSCKSQINRHSTHSVIVAVTSSSLHNSQKVTLFCVVFSVLFLGS